MSSVSASTSTTACSGRPVRSRTTMRRPAPVITPGSAARPRAATVAATVGRGRGRKRRAVSEPSSASDTDSEPAAAPQGRGRGLGRGRGRQARTVGGRRDAIDDGWRLLEGEESEATVPSWIMDFDDRNIGYKGDQDLSDADPIAFLQLFLDDAVFDLLVTETNRYADQFLLAKGDDLRRRSRFHKWEPVTRADMKAFLALHMTMGLVEKHEIEDYWETFWLTSTPGFSRIMSRDRFELILSFLHYANNEDHVARGQPGHDRLFKVRQLIDMIVPKFRQVFSPRKEVAIDEMTIAFKGRSVLKQYNPKKPDKWGFKAFVLSESKSGYVLDWTLYAGKTEDAAAADDASVTHRIVRSLMSDHIGKGHELYIDSYYTSVPIAVELSTQNTAVCGTVNVNRRGMPGALKPNVCPLKKGDDPVYMRKEKLLACAWHDTKRLTMLSTIHRNLCVPKQIKSKDTATGFRDVSKPCCVVSYNSHMGGVDTSDQRIKTYLFPHRSRKWYPRIVNALLSMAVVNSHVVYTHVIGDRARPLSLKNYIYKLTAALLDGYATKDVRMGRPIIGEIHQRLTERHWLDPSGDSRPDCEVCSDRSVPKGRRQTHFKCRQCGVGLCAYPCNERYHTLKHYKLCHLNM